ncbi:MAG: SseB family protein [Sandaracinaceae bacterium]
MSDHDPHIESLHRLLAEANRAPQAKVDALVALIMRTVFVVPWPGGIAGYRTLVNSSGVAALPVFTSLVCLEEASRRFGWTAPDGTVPHAEIGARAAFNYALGQKLPYVVVDIADEHALEVTGEEIQPLLTPAARRESSGPYAAAGKISSSMIRKVKTTPPPDGQLRPTPPPGTLQAPRVPQIEPPSAEVQVRPPIAVSDDSLRFASPGEMPGELYDQLSAALRDYPEVEWAALVVATAGDRNLGRAIALRVDPSFRKRIDELTLAVRRRAVGQGADVEVLLLDSQEAMRAARGDGIVFYPWRKK